MTYQDVWIQGSVEIPGERECSSRYAAIAQVLAQFKRPFTLLDIGAAQGYFSIRASQDFDCVAVMIDPNPELPALCERNAGAGRTILLSRLISTADLERLASCEHFDVVLALNILHHFPEPERVTKAVMSLGDFTIIETPPPDDVGACGQPVIPELFSDLSARGGRLLAQTPSHVSKSSRPMWMFKTPKTHIDRSYIDIDDNLLLGPNRIDATFTEKRIRLERKGEERAWIHGINLRTYQRLQGCYPSRETIAAMVEGMALPDTRHGDIRPWNFILDGTSVHLIDGRDEHAIFDDAEGIEFTVKAIVEDRHPGPWNDSDARSHYGGTMDYYGSKEMAASWRTVRMNTLQAANDIPADQYAVRAADGTMTAGELLAHLAVATHWAQQCHFVEKLNSVSGEDFGRWMGHAASVAASLTTKAAIIEALTANGEEFASQLESMSDAQLAEEVALPHGSKTRFELLLGTKEHEMHHRAQVFMLERIMGIVPHLTRAREAR